MPGEKEMREGTVSKPPSGKATQWLAMMQHSEATIVGWTSKQKSVSSRYRVRAWADVLPAYSNEMKKVNSNGNKADIYGNLLGKGECVCCSGQHLETMEHIVECQETIVEGEKQHSGKTKQDAKTKVSTIWQKADLIEACHEAGWLQGDIEGWKEEWGYLGMVPKSVRPPECVASNQPHALKKCTKLTTLCLLEMSQACWKAKNTQVIEKGGWKESVGITEAKPKKKRTGWTVRTVIGPKL